jgi:hypothetical protein
MLSQRVFAIAIIVRREMLLRDGEGANIVTCYRDLFGIQGLIPAPIVGNHVANVRWDIKIKQFPKFHIRLLELKPALS